MPSLKEVLTTLRSKFKDAVGEYNDEPLSAFDRALNATLLEFIDGNPPAPDAPKKRTYTRKPKATPPAGGE